MQEIDVPSPWKSLARFGLRSALGLVLAVLLWFLWYGYATHRLNQKLAEYRARGEPSSLQDFIHEPVLATDNAEALVFAAGESLKLTADELESVDSPTRFTLTMLPLSDAQMDTAKKMVRDHETTLGLLRKATGARYCVMPFDPVHIENNWMHLSGFRKVSNFLRIVAFYHHQEGRDDLALDDMREIETAARAILAGHFLIHHLVAVSIEDLASYALVQMAPDLTVKSSATTSGASREQVLQIAGEFLDQAPLQEGMCDCLRSERIFDIVKSAVRSRHKWLIPLFRLDAVRDMQDEDVRIHAISPDVPPFPLASSRFPAERPQFSNLEGAAYLLSGNSSAIRHAIELHYRAITDREAAGLRLCIRLYEVDHGGQIPRRLSELVPNYLAALPVDEFRSTGGPFIYDASRRIFYSVGNNYVDDGGVGRPGHDPTWNGKDTVYPLDRAPLPPPPPPPSTEPNPESDPTQ